MCRQGGVIKNGFCGSMVKGVYVVSLRKEVLSKVSNNSLSLSHIRQQQKAFKGGKHCLDESGLASNEKEPQKVTRAPRSLVLVCAAPDIIQI